MTESVFEITTWIIPVLLAITLHEAAHGWAAWKLGDDTAMRLGRVSFNPLRHIDPFGTVLLPAMLLVATGGHAMFGFAKPVPVNFSRLRPLRGGLIAVAAAGPATNLLLLLVGAALLSVLPLGNSAAVEWVGRNLTLLVYFNALLAVFNMIPMPPLDGGRVLVGILPRPLAMRVSRLEKAGVFIVLGVVFLAPWAADRFGVRFDPFEWLVIDPAMAISRAALSLFGMG